MRSAKVRTARSVAAAVQGSTPASSVGDLAEQRPRFGGEQRRRFVVERKRPVGEEKACAVNEIEERLGALL